MTTKIRDEFVPGERCPFCGKYMVECPECGGAMHPEFGKERCGPCRGVV